VQKFAKAQGFGKDQPVNEETTRLQRQAYFAAASFTDSLIGKVLTVGDVVMRFIALPSRSDLHLLLL
jgi:hypothetical protein